MLLTLEKLLQLPANEKWTIGNNQSHETLVQTTHKEEGRIGNLIDFVNVVNFTSNVMRESTDQELNKREIEEIHSRILEKYTKLNDSIESYCLLTKIIIKIIVFICTGSSLGWAMENLKSTPQLRHHSLIKDAEEAMSNQTAYREVSTRYTQPEKIHFNQQHSVSNPLLCHLVNAAFSNWKEISELIKQGKTIEDKEVISLVDVTMNVLEAAGKLLVPYEIEAYLGNRKCYLGETREEKLGALLVDQHIYPWLVYGLISQFYIWLRSCPSYDFARTYSDRAWKNNSLESPDLVEKFYMENTAQAHWRSCWNAFVTLVKENINIDFMLHVDERYITDEDTQEIFQENPQSLLVRILQSGRTCGVEHFIE